MIRVLHVINWLRAGGVETQLLRILSGYDRSRFQMDVCTIGSEPGYLADDARKLGAQILSCHKSPNFISFSNRFARLVKERGYHVVHSHLEPWGGPIMRGAHLARVPVRIVEMHHVWPFMIHEEEPFLVKSAKAALARWGLHWIRSYATHVMAVSKAVVEARWPASWGTEKVITWTGGVDTSRFRPADTHAGSADKIPRIIWVGGLRAIKRVDLQMEVFRQVVEAVPPARLVLVGEGDQEEELRALAKAIHAADSVDFLGVRRDVPELLQSATVFLSCSDAEGLPTVLMEAQAVGLPVVARDIPPHHEVLVPDLHPFLFGVDGLKDAVRNILEIISDPKLREHLGRAGRRHMVEKYDAAKQLDILQDYYEQWVEATRSVKWKT